ncbi:MAG: hypothetical protein HYX59_00455 [Elusimicrobia bacterium]|nr:hypothetical protein [Elusimicrobiota bacterium]
MDFFARLLLALAALPSFAGAAPLAIVPASGRAPVAGAAIGASGLTVSFSAPLGSAPGPLPSGPLLLAPALAAPSPSALKPAIAAAAASPSRPAAKAAPALPAAADLRRLGQALQPKAGAAAPAEGLTAAFDGAVPAAKGDVTAEYLSLMEAPPGASLRAADAPELRELRKYKVLLVPGFFSGAFIRLGDHALWPGRRYFGDQIDWLERMEIDYELADVHTLQSVEHNAPVIARAIESSDKPVIAVTHSMGGNLLLHALVTRPDLRARVRGWAPVQTPFLGSHVAGLPGVGGAASVLRFFGGTGKTVRAMTPEGARAYHRRHRRAIAAVLRAVPVVAFASWVDTSAPRWLGLVNPLAKWAWDAVSRRGGRNDILVPAASAVLPGMAHVSVPGVDHLTPFVDAQVPFDRVRFFKTLLTMVLRREPAR